MELLLSQEHSDTLKKGDKKMNIVGKLFFLLTFPTLYYYLYVNFGWELDGLPFNPLIAKIVIIFIFTIIGYVLAVTHIVGFLVFIAFVVLTETFSTPDMKLEERTRKVRNFLGNKTDVHLSVIIHRWREELQKELEIAKRTEEQISDAKLSKKEKKTIVKENLGVRVWPHLTPEKFVAKGKGEIEQCTYYFEEALQRIESKTPLDSLHIHSLYLCIRDYE